MADRRKQQDSMRGARQRQKRSLSRATMNCIDDVFARVGDSEMPVRQAVEELAARTLTVENTYGDSMPTVELMSEVVGDDQLAKDGFVQFVAARLSASREVAEGGIQGVRFVFGWEYLMSCIRCQAGVPDERGITRYWLGFERGNPRVYLALVVEIAAVLASAGIIGLLFHLTVGDVVSEAERTGGGLLRVLVSASGGLTDTQRAIQVHVAERLVAPLNISGDAAVETKMTALLMQEQDDVQLFLEHSVQHELRAAAADDAQRLARLRTILDFRVVARLSVPDTVAELEAAWLTAPQHGVVWTDTTGSVHRTLFASGALSSCEGSAPSSTQTSLCDRISHHAALTAVSSAHGVTFVVDSDGSGSGTAPRHRLACVQVEPTPVTTAVACLSVVDSRGSTFGGNGMPSSSGWSSCETIVSEDNATSWVDVTSRQPVNPDFAASASMIGLGATTITTRPGGDSHVIGRTFLPHSAFPHLTATQLAVRCNVSRTVVRDAVRTSLRQSTRGHLFWVSAGSNETQPPSVVAAGATADMYGEVSTVDVVSRPSLLLAPVPESRTYSAFERADSGREVIAGWTHVDTLGVGIVVDVDPRDDAVDDELGFIRHLSTSLVFDDDDRHVVVFQADTGITEELRLVAGAPDVASREAVREAARDALYKKRQVGPVERGGEVVFAAPSDERGLVFVVTHSDDRGPMRRLYEYVGIAVGVGIVLCAIVLAFLFVTTASVLGTADSDSTEIKGQMDAEKVQFRNLIRDAMPGVIVQRFRAGETLIADHYPQLTFLFSDIVSFTERTKFMSNQELVRFLGYTFMLLDTVAEYYDVHKIKSIGDAFFAVSGLDDRQQTEKNGAEGATVGQQGMPPHQHQTYRMLSFAAVSQMLLTPMFHHVPERTDCFAENSGGVEQPLFAPAPTRMGVHVGPVHAGVFDAGRAPQFDCFGSTVGVTALLEAAAPAGSIRISEQCRKTLQQVDVHRDFVCSAPQRTLAKNQGRLETYSIVATFLGVPQALLDTLHIDRSVRRRSFGDGGFILDDIAKDKMLHIDNEESQLLSSESDPSEQGSSFHDSTS